MDKEIENLAKHQTYTLVDPSDLKYQGYPVIGSKWQFKIKRNPDRTIKKFKSRLCARGDQQKVGTHFTDEELYAPTATSDSFRILCTYAAHHGIPIRQFDIVGAFLIPTLSKIVLMHQPAGRVDPKFPNHVCLLLRTLYGLHESAQRWYQDITAFLNSMVLTATLGDACLYVGTLKGHQVILLLHVDDMFLAAPTDIADHFASKISEVYDTEDCGEALYGLGIEISRNWKDQTITLHQTSKISELLEDFGMADSIPASTPYDPKVILSHAMCPTTDVEKVQMARYPYRQLIGRINHLAISTRPDITTAISTLSRFAENPGMAHWTAAKHLLRYLKRTLPLGITLGGKAPLKLNGYADASYATCPTTGRSTTGYFFTWGAGPISWYSKLQIKHQIALSSMGAEYYALCDASMHNIWLRQILSDINCPTNGPTTIHEDNKSTVAFCVNGTRHQTTKHLLVKEYAVHEQLHKYKNIALKFIPGCEQPADIFTKPLPRVLFEKHRSFLNLNPSSTQRTDEFRGTVTSLMSVDTLVS